MFLIPMTICYPCQSCSMANVHIKNPWKRCPNKPTDMQPAATFLRSLSHMEVIWTAVFPTTVSVHVYISEIRTTPKPVRRMHPPAWQQQWRDTDKKQYRLSRLDVTEVIIVCVHFRCRLHQICITFRHAACVSETFWGAGGGAWMRFYCRSSATSFQNPRRTRSD